ncbi:hypothetical protein ACLB2K_021973 [Fragaria x ananassa]
MSLTTNVSCRSQSRPATCSLSRTLYTATGASKSQSKNIERIAEDLLDLTKIERQDYSILFRLKMGLNQYGPAVSGIDPTSSESGSASADSKVVESGNYGIEAVTGDIGTAFTDDVNNSDDINSSDASPEVPSAESCLDTRIDEEELRRFYTAANRDFSSFMSAIKKTIRWRETYGILSVQELEKWSNMVFRCFLV